MKNIILARRYAKALFAVATESDSFDEYAKALNDFADMFQKYPEVRDGLTNPVYPLEVREKVMDYLVETMAVSGVIKNFLNLVVHKKRAAVLPDIAESFQALVDEKRNICQGTVVSAMEMGSELKDKVQATLEKITGKKVVLTSEVDPSIIGGIIAKVGDLVLDGSLSSQLLGLKESIKGVNN
jgi:F-type H+-transporting ATPase subunit delta